jgi:hypothetical protein
MCDLSDGDNCSVFTWTRVTRSRKPHRCQSCNATVPAGSSYWRNFSVADGNASDAAQCDACHAISVTFGKEHQWTPVPGYLLECVQGCVDSEGDERWGAALAQMMERYTASQPVNQ